MNEQSSELKERLIQSLFKVKHLALVVNSSANSQMAELGISMAELALMKEIKDNALDSPENAFIADVQKQLFVSKAAVSKMLGVLEKKGYINRDINKENRRTLILTLTPKGKDILESKEQDIDNKLMKIIMKLGKDDIEQFIKSINQFADGVEDVIE